MTDHRSSDAESEGQGPSVSRRSFLKSTSAGTAALAAAASTTSTASGFSGQLSAQEQFLLDRITFGRNPEMAAEIATRGYDGFLSWQLGDSGTSPVLDDTEIFDTLDGLPVLTNPANDIREELLHSFRLTPYEILTDVTYPDPSDPVGRTYPGPQGKRMIVDAPRCLMLGATFGKHQLAWVLTDFFQNVHNTLQPKPLGYLFWTYFVRKSILPNVLGNYADLCYASATGASMLHYLGQPLSDLTNPNENYARELAELHTVGAADYTLGGITFKTYRESDIAPLAEILTGVDMIGSDFLRNPVPPNTPVPGPDVGEFVYSDFKHALGDKKISMTGGFPLFGSKIYPNTGPGGLGPGLGETQELIRDFVTHPCCALYLSRRLVQWFLGDDYQGEFFGPWVRTASAFYGSGGDIREAIRELFNVSYWNELCPAGVRDRKVRRPVNKVLALRRSLSAFDDYTDPNASLWINQQLEMGQLPGFWPAPNGYQPENEKWTTTLQPTLQFYYDAVWGGFGPDPMSPIAGNGLRIPDSTLLDIFPPGSTPAQYGDLAAEALAGGTIPAPEVAAINNAISVQTGPGDLRRWALFYTLTCPSYQYLS